MANWYEPTQEQLDIWTEWKQGRPDCIQALAKNFTPWILYRYKPTNQRVTIASYHEDDTLTVNVLGEFNLVTTERRVFGIKPDDLEECDLPAKDEPLGVMVAPGDQEKFIELARPYVTGQKGGGQGALVEELLQSGVTLSIPEPPRKNN